MLIDSKRPFLLALIFLVTSVAGIMIYQWYQKTVQKNQIAIYTGTGLVKINIEYTDTSEKLVQGLMNRPVLSENSGMLFSFPDIKIREFWMKNMLIPLEIMFIDTFGRINEIITMEPCPPDAQICPVYTSKGPARFAIEVNTGFTAKNNIIEGDILEISGF